MPAARWEIAGGWRRHYIVCGSGERVVLFLHGIPTNHALWREVVAHLGPDARAIAPDLTGFGLSDLPRGADLSPAGQAAAMLALLDRLDVDHFSVVAHDYGVLVACELLARARGRVEGLVITNTSVRIADWSGSGLNLFRLVAAPLVGELAFACARRWMLKLAFRPFVSERASLSDDLLDAFWAPFEHGFAATLLRLFRERNVDGDDERRWSDALASFKGPMTIVWGAQDPVFRQDRAVDVARLAPHATVVMLDHANHFVPIDRPRALARLITAQLTQGLREVRDGQFAGDGPGLGDQNGGIPVLW